MRGKVIEVECNLRARASAGLPSIFQQKIHILYPQSALLTEYLWAA